MNTDIDSQLKGESVIHDCVQGSDEWHVARLGKVTASHFKEAVAGGQGKSRKLLMVKLVAERMTGERTEGFSNAKMDRGVEVEESARDYYEMINDSIVKQVGFVELNENVGASPDGLVGENGLLEIKCPDSHTHIGYILDNKFPSTYMRQVQGQLWVTDRKWCDFVSYDPRVSERPYWYIRVYRDEDYIKELSEKIDMFVEQMLDMLSQLTHTLY